MSYPYILQGGNLVIVIDNQTHNINKTHINYEAIIKAIKAADWKKVKEYATPIEAIKAFSSGRATIKDGIFYWDGVESNSYVATKILQMFKEKFDVEPLIKFLENLSLNPSRTATEELYKFLEKGNMPITPDGYFLAYKKVRKDYKDCHSGKFDNSVGQVLEMERNKVDDNRNNTCSYGFHFCSLGYLNHFSGERIMILKINPKDVVAIPSDYNDTKGRTCRYEVVGEVADINKPENTFTKAVHEESEWNWTKNDLQGWGDDEEN